MKIESSIAAYQDPAIRNANVMLPFETARSCRLWALQTSRCNVVSLLPKCSCQHAFYLSQSPECFWLLHHCSILYCYTHCSIGPPDTSRTVCKDRIAQCAGVSCPSRPREIQLSDRQCRVKGRPHYYSPKKEEYAHIRFDLDAGSSASPKLSLL